MEGGLSVKRRLAILFTLLAVSAGSAAPTASAYIDPEPAKIGPPWSVPADTEGDSASS